MDTEFLPEGGRDVLGPALRTVAGGGELVEPRLAVVGEFVAQDCAELFTALLKAGADELFYLGFENKGRGFTH